MASDSQRRYAVKITRSSTVRRPSAELYAFWRDLENLARIIKHPVTIVARSQMESHWAVTGPVGDDLVEWDGKVINDKLDELIAWRSEEGADVPNAGSVRFEPAPGELGTEVTVTLEYDPPGGKVAGWLAKLTSEEPGHQTADTLRRFKALMETGEIPTTEGQSVGEPQRSKKGKNHESSLLDG